MKTSLRSSPGSATSRRAIALSNNFSSFLLRNVHCQNCWHFGNYEAGPGQCGRSVVDDVEERLSSFEI